MAVRSLLLAAVWLAGLAALMQLPASAAVRVTEAKAEPVAPALDYLTPVK